MKSLLLWFDSLAVAVDEEYLAWEVDLLFLTSIALS